MDESEKLCELCMGEVESVYAWGVQIAIASRGFFSKHICRSCIVRISGCPIERVLFMETLVEYKLKHLKKRRDNWTKEDIDYFIDILKRKEIPIKNYGIPLFRRSNYDNANHFRSETEIYLHKLTKVKIKPSKYIQEFEVNDDFLEIRRIVKQEESKHGSKIHT